MPIAREGSQEMAEPEETRRGLQMFVDLGGNPEDLDGRAVMKALGIEQLASPGKIVFKKPEESSGGGFDGGFGNAFDKRNQEMKGDSANPESTMQDKEQVQDT